MTTSIRLFERAGEYQDKANSLSFRKNQLVPRGQTSVKTTNEELIAQMAGRRNWLYHTYHPKLHLIKGYAQKTDSTAGHEAGSDISGCFA